MIELAALIDVLPPHLQEQTYTNALETPRLIKNENARARALSLLGPHLPLRLLNRALETANQLGNPASQTLRPLASDLKAPYDANGSLAVEQQLPKSLILSVTYDFFRGVNQFRTLNINAPTGFVPDTANPGR